MDMYTKFMFSTHLLTILISILLFLSSHPKLASAATPTPNVPKVYTDYIKSSCNKTTYPSLCILTLTPYAPKVKTSALKLCNYALEVAIQASRNMSETVSKLGKQKSISRIEYAAIKDCVNDMKDAVYELKQTVEAMAHLGDADKNFQWSNAKTYASAAITDADSCMDGLTENKINPAVKNKIKSILQNVARLTSNSLALINHLY